MIAYSDRDVFTVHSDGSHRRQLTTASGYAPVWSPDGTTIAFQRADDIWLMDSTGGSERRLAEGRAPAWAPDGQRLTYECREGTDDTHEYGFSDLCLLDLRTGMETAVVAHTDDWHGVDSSTWSPDGAWIAFTRISAEGDDYVKDRQLFRVKPDGTGLTAIPNTEPLARRPAWSPDGATILYTKSYDGRGGEYDGDLWSIRPDGTGKTRVTRSPGTEDEAAWSSDGLRIAMNSTGGLLPNKRGVWTINADGRGAQFVVRYGSSPSWRPGFTTEPPPETKVVRASGPRIAYVAASDAGFDLFTVRPNGNGIRRVTSSGRVVEPVWSPDRAHIAYGDNAQHESTTVLRVVDVRTRTVERVGRYFHMSSGGHAWSPDGQRLVAGTSGSLLIFDLRTHKQTSIPIATSGSVHDPTWSRDGTRIAFSLERDSGNSDIMVVPARGGRSRVVTRLRGFERDLDWSPDGRRILFSYQRWYRRPGEVNLLSVRPDGTGRRRVVNTPQLDVSPAWSPNGRRVALYSDGPRPFGASPKPGLWTVGAVGRAAQLVVRDRTIAYVDW